MTLHGSIMVNGTPIGAWAANRVETGSPNTYECQVEMFATPDRGRGMDTFQVSHFGDDGAVILAAKVLDHAGHAL